MPERVPSAEENKLAEQSAIASSRAAIAESELKLAQSKKSLQQLTDPPPTTPLDEAKTAEAIAAAIKNRQISLQEALKGPEVKAPDGKITATGNFIESEIIAHQALKEVLRQLIVLLGKEDPFKAKPVDLVLHNPADYTGIHVYNSIVAEMQQISIDFEQALQAASDIKATEINLAGGSTPMDLLLPGYAIAGAVRTVADIASLFRVDTSFTNFDITVDETELVTGFAAEVHAAQPEWSVYYPAVYPVGLMSRPGIESSAFTSLTNTLQKLDARAAARIMELDKQAAGLQDAITNVTEPSVIDKNKTDLDICNRRKELLSAVSSNYQQLDKLLNTADAAGSSIRATMIRSEKLIGVLAGDNAYVVKLLSFTKGSSQIKQGLFRSASLRHSGGTDLSCLVFNKAGKIVFARNLQHYIPYRKAGELGRS